MTQTSRFWEGTITGDATTAPYDAPTEFAAVLRSLGITGSPNRSGIFVGELNELAFSIVGAAARIASGRALVDGEWYQSSADEDLAIATPGAATRFDRIVLRKSWALQTVRLTLISGTEGGGAPAVTQVDGTTWDMQLYTVQITTAGVITLAADDRNFLPLLQLPCQKIYRNTVQSIPNGAGTFVSWSSSSFGIGTAMFAIGQPTRLTINRDGLYRIAFKAYLAIGATAYSCILLVRANATTILDSSVTKHSAAAGGSSTSFLSFDAWLFRGDYLEFSVEQNSGGAADLWGVDASQSWAQVSFMQQAVAN